MMCRCGIWQNKTFSIDLIYDMFIRVCLFLYDLIWGCLNTGYPLQFFFVPLVTGCSAKHGELEDSSR